MTIVLTIEGEETDIRAKLNHVLDWGKIQDQINEPGDGDSGPIKVTCAAIISMKERV